MKREETEEGTSKAYGDYLSLQCSKDRRGRAKE